MNNIIKEILDKYFREDSGQVFKRSNLIQYINIKFSKKKISYTYIYAIYVLLEDYINNGFYKKGNYSEYKGARYLDLQKRQRELPFGANIQIFALNSRTNDDFKLCFPTCHYSPIIRVNKSRRFKINENLLLVETDKEEYNIAQAIIEIIDIFLAISK